MVDATLGGFAARVGYTDGFVRSWADVANARQCVDNTRPMIVTHLNGALSGRGATRTAQIYLGSSSANISRASSSQAQDTGWINTSDWLTFGGNEVEFGYRNLSGQCYFARSSSSGATNTQTPYSMRTGTLGMRYRYQESPAAPSITSVVPSADGTSAIVTFSTGNNGGTGFTGHRIQRATNSGFTSGVVTTNVSSSPAVITGLTPGQGYFWRVLSRNRVTDQANKLGSRWSGSLFREQPDPPSGGGLIRSGSSWVPSSALIRAGSSWVPAQGLIRAGGSWVSAA